MGTMDDRLVRDIALAVPGAIHALEAHHLDYCCGGGRTLRDACMRVGASVDAVVADIENEARRARTRGETGDATMSVGALIDRIVTHHHALVTREDPRLRALARKVVNTHAAARVELRRTQQLVDALFEELRPHQLREERVLFPHIEALARAEREGVRAPHPPFGSVERPLRVLEDEHESMGAVLEALRASCDEFRAPACACVSWRALYQGLEELERDLVRHLHLENNVLFPLARELEARLEAQ